MKTYSIQKSLFVLISIAIFILTSGIGIFWLYSEFEKFNAESTRLESEILAEKKATVRNVVDSTFDYMTYRRGQIMSLLKKSLRDRVYEAHSFATNIHAQYRSSKGDAEIKKIIIEGMRPIRFNSGRGYFFAGDEHGIEQLFADRPEMEGKDLYDMRDTRGAYVIRDMIDIVTGKGEGFYTYYWTKPGVPGKNHPKMAFVKLLEPYRWFLGTGEYLDDFESDIQKEVLERISHIRFGKNNDGYIFVVTYTGTTIMNPMQPEMIGQNHWELTDPDGVKVIQDERKAAQKPGGDFIYYKWPKPGTGKIIMKVSFIRGIDEWQWMFGAGAYLDEIDTMIADKKKELGESVLKSVLRILVILLMAYILALSISIFLARRFNREFGIFASFFQKSEKSNIPIDNEKLKFTEFKILADSANRMVAGREKIQRELIEAKDRAIEANQAKNYFLASVSHEIRTPMNAIMGMTDLVLQTDLDDEQKEFIELVKLSTDNLLNLINNILEFSKIESKKISLESRNFSIISVLQQTVRLFEPAAREKSVTLKLDIDENVPTHVNGDPRLLTQVLVNLISNSIKFTDRGGIVVQAEKVDHDNGSSSVTLSFSVADTGIGIPADKLDIIFDSFRQADPSFTRKYGGAGLGLTISKELIELMGGFISVKSEHTKGSTFSFVIPFITSDGSAAENGRIEDEHAELIEKSYSILVAEDNEVNARMATIMLEKKGHSVGIARNGIEALEKISNGGFDLVLMDIEMPEIDGIEATRLVRQGRAGEAKKDIPIIAMSAHVLEDIKNECIRVGMNDFIAKPVNIAHINRILARAMAKHAG